MFDVLSSARQSRAGVRKVALCGGGAAAQGVILPAKAHFEESLLGVCISQLSRFA